MKESLFLLHAFIVTDMSLFLQRSQDDFQQQLKEEV